MPNKLPIEGDNPFHNFMRIHKNKYPAFERLSRRIYYPFVGKLYQKWKIFYNQNYKKNDRNEIKSMYDFLKL